MHVDPASMQPSLDLDQTDGDIPEGAMRFQVEAQDIADCLSAPSPQVPTPQRTASYWSFAVVRSLTSALA